MLEIDNRPLLFLSPAIISPQTNVNNEKNKNIIIFFDTLIILLFNIINQ
ncbi:hypothetical protein NSB1T_09010 [Coprobacter fastidiosus NSB1 = JCM 33896]|nr:hypothetical protein NSB1T_09010 [Coprobacter fastidiosus NSB1 = JCM 33896]